MVNKINSLSTINHAEDTPRQIPQRAGLSTSQKCLFVFASSMALLVNILCAVFCPPALALTIPATGIGLFMIYDNMNQIPKKPWTREELAQTLDEFGL